VLTTGHAGHGRELAREAAADSRVVVAAGGDGTVNEVAQGLAGSETPLTVLPTGTANVLAHELRIRKRIVSAFRTIVHGKRRRMDLGRVIVPQGGANHRDRFACMVSCGFDAAVVQTMEGFRTGNISYAHYVPVILKTLCDYTYPRLSVILDGRLWDKRVCLVIISNTRSYGGPFPGAYHAACDDGLLDVVLLEYPGPGWLLTYMASLVVRGLLLVPGAELIRARRVRVESEEPAPYQLDGDYAGEAPLEVEVEPGALTVLTTRRRWKHEYEDGANRRR